MAHLFSSGTSGVSREAALFLSTFSTLLAIINPFEVLPVFLGLLSGKSADAHRAVALRACFYALALILFFLVFGAFILKFFGVPLSMVRIAGGIVLMRLGFELFSPSSSGGAAPPVSSGTNVDIAFMPLAMPLMCGPGAIATVLGMTATVKKSSDEIASFVAILAAVFCSMFVIYLCLVFAGRLSARLGLAGIDAATRIVGFFVSAMGVGLIFDGVIEALQMHGSVMQRRLAACQCYRQAYCGALPQQLIKCRIAV
jgi:multiple antibiotic resistance protein